MELFKQMGDAKSISKIMHMHKTWSKLPRINFLSSTSILISRARELPRPHHSISRQLYASLSTLFTTSLLRLTFPSQASTSSCSSTVPGMASSGVNVSNSMLLVPSPPLTLIAYKHTQVLRYTALLTGVGYGFYHQASISARAKIAHIDREFENQASLIAKAKAEWVKKTMPKEAKEGGGEFAFS